MKSYQEVIASLELETERLNWRLVLTFTVSLVSLLPAIVNFLQKIPSFDPGPYLNSLSGGVVEFSYQPALAWLSSYLETNFFLTVAAVFILFVSYHLYVTVYVAKFVSWLSKKTKRPFGYYQVYNSLLLVYAVKTLLDVFVIGLFLRQVFVGLDQFIEYSIWVENIAIYTWLYFILKNIKQVESPTMPAGRQESQVKSPLV